MLVILDSVHVCGYVSVVYVCMCLCGMYVCVCMHKCVRLFSEGSKATEADSQMHGDSLKLFLYIYLYLGLRDKMPEAYVRVPFYCACTSMCGRPVCNCTCAAVQLSR